MKLDDNLAYPDNKDGDVIQSPDYDIPFFFADLDFDRKDELINRSFSLWRQSAGCRRIYLYL